MSRQIVQYNETTAAIIHECKEIPSFEEHKLFMLMQAGNEDAKSKLILANVRIVAETVSHYFSTHFTHDDLFQVGIMGIIVALDRFNPEECNTRFCSYAKWHVRDQINNAIREEGSTIRIPVNVRNDIAKAVRLSKKTGELEFTSENSKGQKKHNEVAARCYNLMNPVSFDVPVGEGDGQLADIIADAHTPATDMSAETRSLRNVIDHDLLATLPKRERDIVDRTFGITTGIEETLQEIGELYGITRERVRQIRDNGIEILARKANKMQLKPAHELAGVFA